MGLLSKKATVSVEELLAQQAALEAAVKATQAAADNSVEFEVVIAASGGKGGFLREAHPELASGLVYCSIVKWNKGQCFTSDGTGEMALWTPEEMIESSVGLRLPLEAVKALEKEFNKRAPSQLGGRAAQIKIYAEENFSMNTEGVFFASVVDTGDLMAPEGITPSINEQRELMAKKKLQSRDIRDTRIQAGRNARSASRLGAQQAAAAQSAMTENVETITEDDLANVAV